MPGSLAGFDEKPLIIHYHALLSVYKKMQQLTCNWAKQRHKSATMGGLLYLLIFSNCFPTMVHLFFYLMK